MVVGRRSRLQGCYWSVSSPPRGRAAAGRAGGVMGGFAGGSWFGLSAVMLTASRDALAFSPSLFTPTRLMKASEKPVPAGVWTPTEGRRHKTTSIVPRLSQETGDSVDPLQEQEDEEIDADSQFSDQGDWMENFADEELLAKYRKDRQQQNDQWQFNVFAQAFNGTWSGIWSEYAPVPGSEESMKPRMKLVAINKGRQVMDVDVEGRKIAWKDLQLLMPSHGGPVEPQLLDEQYFLPSSFRADNGAMAADNAFTMSRWWRAEGGKEFFDAEIWIRGTPLYRTRCSFVYARQADGSDEAPFKLIKMVVKKEKLGTAGPTMEESELFGKAGPGIYDRSSIRVTDWEMPVPGGVTVTFPPIIGKESNGVLTVDWIAGPMRYQADRLFERPDGTLNSLQLTQIGSRDSFKYIPEGQQALKPES